VLRPTPTSRRAGWAFFTLGLLFGATGLASGDIGATVTMTVFAAVMVAIGLALATARAGVDRNGIRYRHGLVRREVPAADVQAVRLEDRSGVGYPRLCIHVQRRDGIILKLTALQARDTEAARARLLADAGAAAALLETAPST